MVRAVVKEISQLCILMIVISFMSYLVLYYLPGSSDTLKQGTEKAGGNVIEEQKSITHITKKYFVWFTHALQGDFGTSDFSGRDVIRLILPRLTRTLLLAFGVVISVLVGAVVWVNFESWLVQDVRRSHVWAKAMRAVIFVIERILLSFIPLTMAVLIYAFFSHMGIAFLNLEVFQRGFFPWLTLVLLNLPLYIRSLKKSISLVRTSKFVRFAQTLGYTERWIWWREILPNAGIFTLTLSIVQLSYLVGGVIIVERIFLYPGLGSEVFHAVMNRDRNMVQAIVVLVAFMVAFIHMCFSLYKEKIYGRNDA